MIGLMFLGAALLWLLLVIYLTVTVPRWLGLQRSKAWLLRSLLLPLLLVGPFADHLIGMWQFEKLCVEDGRLEISPAAANTKRARELDAQSETPERLCHTYRSPSSPNCGFGYRRANSSIQILQHTWWPHRRPSHARR